MVRQATAGEYRIIDYEPGEVPTCPRCLTPWPRVVLDVDADGRERSTCYMCKAPFFRTGGSCRFRSPDGLSVLLVGAGGAAEA